ncbi:hypothetical protein BDQ17DRAFT_628127 [Cyathus striatus]|nr:hypothetical protein BDQ17DRAFT_628127 [Cyathus striatus]
MTPKGVGCLSCSTPSAKTSWEYGDMNLTIYNALLSIYLQTIFSYEMNEQERICSFVYESHLPHRNTAWTDATFFLFRAIYNQHPFFELLLREEPPLNWILIHILHTRASATPLPTTFGNSVSSAVCSYRWSALFFSRSLIWLQKCCSVNFS